MRNAEALLIPKGVGPHAGRELSLMLTGKKPLAMFSSSLANVNWLAEADFAPYVDYGLIVRREKIYPGPNGGAPNRYLYFARVGEKWRIERLISIHKELFVDGRSAGENDHIAIGQLLGYSDDEIAVFLLHARSVGSRLRAAEVAENAGLMHAIPAAFIPRRVAGTERLRLSA